MFALVETHEIVIVGAGPAGLAPLFAAGISGRLSELLDRGIVILERSSHIGAGSLAGLGLPSDSPARAFLDIVVKSHEPRLRALDSHPLTRELAAFADQAAPLTLVGAFLELAAATLCRIVAASPRGRVLTGVEVQSVQRLASGTWRTRFVHLASGFAHTLESRSVLLATGARQPFQRLLAEPVAGVPLLPRFEGKVVQSGELFRPDHLPVLRQTLAAAARLSDSATPRIAIVGGSTSALAAATLLLREIPELAAGRGSITILHRRPLRPCYDSPAAALDDGFTNFSASDICPLTGRVFRLGGLRYGSRDLLRSLTGLGGRAPEPRVTLQTLVPDQFAAANDTLAAADLIVAALGYRPRLAAVLDEAGEPIHLFDPHSNPAARSWAVVDARSRVLTATCEPLPGLYALGLAVGPVATRELGGEAGFTDQVNSLWLWQNTLGQQICTDLLQPAPLVHQPLSGPQPRRTLGTPSAAAAPLSTPSVAALSPAEPSRVVPIRASQESVARPTILPVVQPNPPRLSQYAAELAEIESNGTYTNFGPVNTRFEQLAAATFFGNTGECLTVSNATLGLMLSIREVIGDDRPFSRRFALMPSFTFAATAQAAMWCGLTPVLCDMDPATWLPSAQSEEALLQNLEGDVAVVIPYATFGNNLDLDRYQRLSERFNVPVVVDAAASLGSRDFAGRGFGTGFSWPVVFSMHATKVFSAGEGGLIYSADSARLARLRAMSAFGFESGRSATLPGLNAKLTEVAALTALLQLQDFPSVLAHRQGLAAAYARALGGQLTLQAPVGTQQASAFQPVLLPSELSSSRARIIDRLLAEGVGTGTYFSPHLAEQPHIRHRSVLGPLSTTEDIAARVLALPLHASMSVADVERVSSLLLRVIAESRARLAATSAAPAATGFAFSHTA